MEDQREMREERKNGEEKQKPVMNQQQIDHHQKKIFWIVQHGCERIQPCLVRKVWKGCQGFFVWHP